MSQSDRLVQLVRWFNRASPWHQPKPSLAKRVAGRLPDGAGPAVYENIQGCLRMELDLANYFEQWIYLNVYDVVTVELIRKLLPYGGTYVDAGANVGFFVLLAAERVGPRGKVFAFEPAPRALRRLRANLALNETSHVELIEKGVWSEPGEATLYDFADGSFNEGSLGARPDKQVGEQITIATTRIDDHVDRPVDVFKIDVEGAEREALKGATRTLFGDHPTHILIELNRKTCEAFGYEPIELLDWILTEGPRYRLHLLKSKRRRPTTRDELAELIDREPRKLRNVWLQPLT
jgi:FkbM family methyltransferase